MLRIARLLRALRRAALVPIERSMGQACRNRRLRRGPLTGLGLDLRGVRFAKPAMP